MVKISNYCLTPLENITSLFDTYSLKNFISLKAIAGTKPRLGRLNFNTCSHIMLSETAKRKCLSLVFDETSLPVKRNASITFSVATLFRDKVSGALVSGLRCCNWLKF